MINRKKVEKKEIIIPTVQDPDDNLITVKMTKEEYLKFINLKVWINYKLNLYYNHFYIK